MKLNMFNRWKTLGKMSGHVLEYRTEKAGSNTFATLIRDQKTGNVVTRGYARNQDDSLSTAHENLKRAGTERILQAIESGESIGREISPQQRKESEPRKDIEWRDGANHAHRAVKKIVGEGVEFDLELDPSLIEKF